MKKSFITKNVSPCYFTHMLYAGISTLFSALGYYCGCRYVKANYYVGDPNDYLLGGYPGALVLFGLSLQVCVDLAKTKFGKSINDTLSAKEEALVHSFRSNFFSRYCREDTAISQALQTPLSNNLSTVIWEKGCMHKCKIALFRWFHYWSALLIGLSALAMPIGIIYSGGDIFDKSLQQLCLCGAFFISMIEMGLAIMAYRSDNQGGQLLELEVMSVSMDNKANMMMTKL